MRARILNWCGLCLLIVSLGGRAAYAQQPHPGSATVLEIAGTVQFLPAGSANWRTCHTNEVLYPGDQLRTGPRSRAAVRLSDKTVFRMGEQSYLRIRPEQKKRSALEILRGVLYFFHRDNPGEFDLQTPIVSAVVRGTEFHIEVAEDNTTTVTVLDGEVELANNFGELALKSGQQGIAEPGQAPRRTAIVATHSIIQWSLYYPGVLDTDELSFTDAEKEALADSLSAYRSGDLLAALAKYPADRAPASSAEQIYIKAIELAVGRTTNAAKKISTDDTKLIALDAALDRVIGIVQAPQPTNGLAASAPSPDFATATEWMAESIFQQSRHDLPAALEAARQATAKSPKFGFAWERVAELEFSFGRIAAAKHALDRSIELTPRNAQAHALRGFLFAAENRIDRAIRSFNEAITLDAALGNAWLGRGLSRIRKGDVEGGRQDIQVAATVEPQRAAFRSYLGKAFSQTGDNRRAKNELALARDLDPNDPTAWLYSALIKQQENRINDAVKDFEEAQDRANNRAVYRSRLLLDQDRAVSGVNLAGIYQDAGMTDVSVREAGRAVSADYSVYSSHLFLANSYNALRDVRQINLRYETPAVSEYLVANLLAPVGAGILSPHVTQQEYSKLFESDRVGVSSTTEYLSRGDWYWALSHYGTMKNSSYALDGEYRLQNGDRPNNELEQYIASFKFKQQLTPNDSVFVQAIVADTTSGDLRQVYDPNNPNSIDPFLKIDERQAPLALLGYHHQWNPGSHTLFLAGYLQDTLHVTTPTNRLLFVGTNASGVINFVSQGFVNPAVAHPAASFGYRSDYDAYTVELQQIWKPGGASGGRSYTSPTIGFQPLNHTLILGARVQGGTIDTTTDFTQSTPSRLASNGVVTIFTFNSVATNQQVDEDFQRFSVYAYDNWQLFDSLLLSAGVTYDYLEFPKNFRYAPVAEGQVDRDKLSPKAGLVWTPLRDTTVRAAYTRSLAGVSFDQSFQLEPSQIAGFNQLYRSLIPESVAGAIAGAEFETWGVSFEQKLDPFNSFNYLTYFGAQAEWLNSDARRDIGVWDALRVGPRIAFPDTTPQELDYEELTVLVTLNQLLGEYVALGARYRFSQADLQTHLTEISPGITPNAHTDDQAALHQLSLTALAHHPSGIFGQIEGLWTEQSNRGDSRSLPGDSFWHLNAFVGYRFPRRQAELRVGVLNITDKDYRLNPLNLTPDLPRDRTLLVSLRFHY
jgi:tetratricopeptide (TPR) repeat protein